MPTIASIISLPSSPLQDTGTVGIIITSGVPSFFEIRGSDLDQIAHVDWYPINPASLSFLVRQVILVDNTTGTFMIQITDNYLNTNDRGGKVSFTFTDGSTIAFPARTYGRVSAGSLWTSPNQGLITG